MKMNSYIWADVVAGQERDSYAPGGAHAILVFKSCPCDDPGPGVTHTLGFLTFLWLHHEMFNSFLILFSPDDTAVSALGTWTFSGADMPTPVASSAPIMEVSAALLMGTLELLALLLKITFPPQWAFHPFTKANPPRWTLQKTVVPEKVPHLWVLVLEGHVTSCEYLMGAPLSCTRIL